MVTLFKIDSDCKLVVKTYLNAYSSPRKPTNSSEGSLLFDALVSTGVLVIVIIFLYVLVVLRYDDLVGSIDDAFGDEGIYRFFSFSRFLSISLSLYKLQLFQDIVEPRDCFLSNPVFELSNPPCNLCKDVHTVLDLSGVSNFSENFHLLKIPFMVKNAFPTPIKLDALETIVAKHFGLEKFPSEIDSQVTLDLTHYNLTRALRDILPRPADHIPKITWVDVHHKLVIDGPSSPFYQLVPQDLDIIYVMQLHGRRTIQLLPTRNCKATCYTLSVCLEPGDVVYYNIFLWNAISKPVDDKITTPDLSIIRIGSLEA